MRKVVVRDRVVVDSNALNKFVKGGVGQFRFCETASFEDHGAERDEIFDCVHENRKISLREMLKSYPRW